MTIHCFAFSCKAQQEKRRRGEEEKERRGEGEIC
jgi:hypothetical protein